MASDKPRYWCATKAIRRNGSGPPKIALHWMFARRGILRVWPDRVTCGNWTIPFDDITEAVVYAGASPMGRTRVLMLRTADASWQFGMNPWADPVPHLAIPVEERPLEVRLMRLGWLVYMVLALAVVLAIIGP